MANFEDQTVKKFNQKSPELANLAKNLKFASITSKFRKI